MIKIKDDLSIVLSGEAGQGIQSIEVILTALLKKAGFNLFATKEYMSRVRGGVNSTLIRVSSNKVAGYLERIDILIPLKNECIDHLKKRISEKTVVIGEKNRINYEGIIDVDFSAMAKELGSEIYSNTIAAGIIASLLRIDIKLCETYLRNFFSRKSGEIIDKNIEAVRKGYSAGGNLSGEIIIELNKNDAIADDMVLTGADAITLGAIAGGCDYVCGYPMSPSTTVLEKSAEYSKKFDIIVEQVEDEVGVVNMALGAWYAGARAMVTTSGGGFALMTEGMSLCGMIESPLVVHLAQRPGPATGLPTRTEQGDLNLALYAGHGEFPRIILAPGSLEEGYELSCKAFVLADEYQVPVIILTDQFFVDSYYNTSLFETDDKKYEKKIMVTSKDYARFKFTDSGISPRGIPGNGDGNVCVDSDEHDETGHITEDIDLRIRMTDKRLSKNKLIVKESGMPGIYGDPKAYNMIICWGSTLNTVVEAVKLLNDDNIAVVHFSWIYPLYEGTSELLKDKRLIAVENNETGQFAKLLKRDANIDIKENILKYDGLPFSVEEVCGGIKKILRG